MAGSRATGIRMGYIGAMDTRSPPLPLRPLSPGALVSVRWPRAAVGTVLELHTRPHTGDEAQDELSSHYTVLVGGQVHYVRRWDMESLQ